MGTYAPTLIDSHCHFDFDAFEQDRDALWVRCQQQGMAHLLLPGVEARQWPKLDNLCEQYKEWSYAVGWHPWYLDSAPSEMAFLYEQLEQAARAQRCVAIGECGLDALKGPDMQRQRQVLQVHIDLARALQLPLILHCVKAHGPLMQLIKEAKLSAGVVIHGFYGSKDLALQWLKLGVHLGIGAAVTHKRAHKLREAVRALPLEAVLLETDAPAMSPSWLANNERNSPEQLPAIAAYIAELRGEESEHLLRSNMANCKQLFGF
ncbi:TatD family hydrolase [Agaribacterium sp. ZY112]|uniref:TatD family hydrolase n=1 Tax=Agaribacterium sp. ZY112 TaxID=3233574 RepID=UPI003525A57C